MIWFFLAGMIAGAVGLYMYASWSVRRDEKKMCRMLSDTQKIENAVAILNKLLEENKQKGE